MAKTCPPYFGRLRSIHPKTGLPVALVNALIEVAEAGTHATTLALKRRLRRRVGATLRPGPETPLWNELVRLVLPHLQRRGSKARLARTLGLPRQRLQDCLKARTASLDAERTLLLLCWLATRNRDREALL